MVDASVLGRLLSELPLPLAPDAGILDALALAVAIEDGVGVVLPDALISVSLLQSRESIQTAVRGLDSDS